MNSKTAKRIRREANYHPSNERKYIRAKHHKRCKGEHDELSPNCSRFLYRELKKEEKLKGNTLSVVFTDGGE